MVAAARHIADDLMPITFEAVEARRARGIREKLLAHYQLLKTRELGRDVFWVECYDRQTGEFESGHTVTLADDNGYLWGGCECRWFIEFRHGGTVCKHLVAAVDMQRERG